MLETQLLGKSNSLKLRMGIRIVDVPAMSAKAQSVLQLLLVVEYSLLMQIMQLYNTELPLILIQYGLI
jgi:hypothetical protein